MADDLTLAVWFALTPWRKVGYRGASERSWSRDGDGAYWHSAATVYQQGGCWSWSVALPCATHDEIRVGSGAASPESARAAADAALADLVRASAGACSTGAPES